ncbi:MAG: aminotransferase class V-fold PLP-dependent enzyme [Verrucomicrobiales bacterium]
MNPPAPTALPPDFLARLDADESYRRAHFPVARDRIFLAHAAIAVVPQVAVDAMQAFNVASADGSLDYSGLLLQDMDRIRGVAGRLLGCGAGEVALLGPTSLGLSLVANGLDWQPGDEVVCHHDDYAANVYPWLDLERFGVRVIRLQPSEPGLLTPELIASVLGPKTRLVSLASAHFLSGRLLDVDAIGRLVHHAGALFCVDAIQTLGAQPISLKEVDFLSADSHKWLLGPLAAGVFYVRAELQERLRPSLQGAWNVKSPNFLAVDSVAYEAGARRYEPGVLNVTGLLGMEASLEMLLQVGVERVASRIDDLRWHLAEGLLARGWRLLGPARRATSDPTGGILSATLDRPGGVLEAHRTLLSAGGVVTSLRHDREGIPWLRFSPHFYNTIGEMDRVLSLLA